MSKYGEWSAWYFYNFTFREKSVPGMSPSYVGTGLEDTLILNREIQVSLMNCMEQSSSEAGSHSADQ